MGDPSNKDDVLKLAESIKESGRPPFECPFCNRSYQTLAGCLSHLGAAPPNNTLVPKCSVATPAAASSSISLRAASNTPRGSGRNTPRPQSPASAARKKARLPLTYEESQRLVEVKLTNDYHRVPIDDELGLEAEKCQDLDDDAASGVYSNPGTPRGGGTPGRSGGKGAAAKSKSKSKRKGVSKLQSAANEDSSKALVPLPVAEVEELEEVDFADAPDRTGGYHRFLEMSQDELDDLVEYDMDEEDTHWLEMMNEQRKEEGLAAVQQSAFEKLMDRFEKECFFESHLSGCPNEANPYNIDENAVCCICNDGECHNTNAILFCDMCNLAVHQECYGVPYIPEGQWLCRRCMHSPSRVVSCVLCPNRGGAFKQTSEGRWAHMLCALWIPEVQFANPVFLEPIDNIEKIPAARWKLTCCICNRRHGACIQCSSKNCYVSFHASCAQQKGLFMKFIPCHLAEGGIKKVAYCKSHSPRRGSVAAIEEVDIDGGGEKEGEDMEQSGGEEQQDSDSSSRGLTPRATVPPIVNLPFVPRHRLNRISARVNLPRKTLFISMLVSYWKLKRQSRNGVPLIRRLQASRQGQRVNMYKLSEEELDTMKEQLSIWKKLRHDLERVRMLAELSRRREKQKKELIQVAQQMFEARVCPAITMMRPVLSYLQKKDAADIFAEPVSAEDVPDYHEVIKEPMDFSTMQKKVDQHQYLTLDDFERDFDLVWRNAMTYNDPSTVYYRAAVRMKQEGTRALKQARDNLEHFQVDPVSGISSVSLAELLEGVAPVDQEGGMDGGTTGTRGEKKERSKEEEVREVGPESPTGLEERLEVLQQQLLALDQLPARTRSQRKRELEMEVAQLKKQVKQKRKAAINSSGIDPLLVLDIILAPSRSPRPPRRSTASTTRHRFSPLSPQPSRRSALPEPKTAPVVSRKSSSEVPESPQLTTEVRKPLENDCSEAQSHPATKKRRARKPTGISAMDKDEEMGEGVSLHVLEETGTGEDERKRRGRKIPRRHVDTRAGKRTESTDSDSTQQARGKLPGITRKRCHGSIEKVDGTAADTEDHVSEDEKKQENKRRRGTPSSRRNGTMRGSSRRGRRDGGRKSVQQSLLSYVTQKVLLSEGEAPTESKPPGLSDGGTLTEEAPQVPTATTEDMLTVSVDQASSKKSRSRRAKDASQPAKRQRKASESRQPRTSQTMSTEEECTEEKRLKLESEPEAVPVTPQAKEENDHSSSAEASDSGEESSEEGSDADHVPFLDLKEEPYEGEGFRHWDVVWAKCPGYPRYPALIVDPYLPRRGTKYFGAPIKCPSDAVFKLKKKASSKCFLVNFFDARRTWYWLPGSKLELLGAEPKQDEMVLKGTPIKSKRSVQQAYNRAKSFLKMVALGKEQQQPQDKPTSSSAPPESLPIHENGPRSIEKDGLEAKECDEDAKQRLCTNRLQATGDDSHFLSEDIVRQGRNAIGERLPNSMQAAMVVGTPHTHEGIPGSTNHVYATSNAQTTASTTDGLINDALRHEQSLLCQEDGVNLADSFRVGRKECRDQSFIAEDTTPMGSVDAPPNVHGVA